MQGFLRCHGAPGAAFSQSRKGYFGYHPSVTADLVALGRTEARAILDVISKRIEYGEPDKSGKPLAGALSGCRRIRTGSARIVYRVSAEAVEVLVVAVGQRRDAEVCDAAEKRV